MRLGELTRSATMDEIALLQAQLAAVQQQEAALKLSDHNVIDLLSKLQQLGKIQFVHTLTGKQILTPRQIEREIEDHIALNGGRISLSELQQLLSIDRSYVERHVAQVARANKNASGPNASQYFVVNNGEEVITNWYLDAIMEDTNTLLQESGTTTIGELAQQFGFAVEYMKEVVASRLGSILRAQERGNVLYTDSFVESQKAQIRGVFAAITRPTFVPDVTRSYRFEEKVVDEYLPELIQKRVLMGTLRGREYVPYVFMDAQRESMYSFYQQNGYLDHARAQQLQVSRPHDFLKKRFPDTIPLKDCVVSHTLQLQLEGSIEVAVNEASFVDVRTILPSAINTVDAGMLLSKSPFVARGSDDAVQMGDVYAVSKAFLSASLDMFKKDAAVKAQKASLSQQRSLSAAARESTDNGDADDDDDDDDGGKRGRRGKKSTKVAGDEGDKKSKRNKATLKAGEDGTSKSKKGKRGKKGAADDDGDDITGATKRTRGGKQDSTSVSISPSREEIQEMIAKAFPQTEDDEELLELIAEFQEAEIEKIYAAALVTALSSIHRGDAVSLRELRKKFEDQLDDLMVLLTIFEKGYNKLELHVDAKDTTGMEHLKAVEVHLLETIGAEIATLVTSYVAASQNVEMEDVPALDALVQPPPPSSVDGASDENSTESPQAATRPLMLALSDENKKALEKNLQPATASAVVRLWTFTTAGRRSLSDFMTHLPAVANALSVPLRKMDRKRERQVVFAYRHSVIGAFESVADEDYAAIAALVMQLFFQQTTGLPASLPRNNVGVSDMVLRAFTGNIPAAAAERLRNIVDVAARLAAGDLAESDDWEGLVEEARALVVAKDIGAAASAVMGGE